MKRFLTFALVLVLLLSLVPCAFAASDEAVSAANALHALGLFNGTGTLPDGTPNFDLDRTPTRHESITMLVRLLGKESEAQKGTWSIPFTDVADWAKPYVGYAYTNGLTNGTSETTYDGDDPITASQYITLALRALGYNSGSDFQWDKAWLLSDTIGLTAGQYNEGTTAFTRGDVAIVSNTALDCKLKDFPFTLRSLLPGSPDAPAENLTPESVRTEIMDRVFLGAYECIYNGAENYGLLLPAFFEGAITENYTKALLYAAAIQTNFRSAQKHFTEAYNLCGDYNDAAILKTMLGIMIDDLSEYSNIDMNTDTLTEFVGSSVVIIGRVSGLYSLIGAFDSDQTA